VDRAADGSECRWARILLDGLPPAALTTVRQVAEELTVRESMIFLDGREFTGEPPGQPRVIEGRTERVLNDPVELTDP
jgi:hypothetical protein